MLGEVSARRIAQERLRGGLGLEAPGGKVQGSFVQDLGVPAGKKSPRRESLLTWCVPRSYWTVFLLWHTQAIICLFLLPATPDPQVTFGRSRLSAGHSLTFPLWPILICPFLPSSSSVSFPSFTLFPDLLGTPVKGFSSEPPCWN